MTVPSETTIARLNLSPRLRNVLLRAHITSVGEVLKMSDEELLKIRLLGDKSLEQLREKLAEWGQVDGPDKQSEYATHVKIHIAALTTEVTNHTEFELDARAAVLTDLLHLQYALIELENFNDESLVEKISMLQAGLQEIHHHAPSWVMDRIKSMFSDQAVAASMGAALGVALTRLF